MNLTFTRLEISSPRMIIRRPTKYPKRSPRVSKETGEGPRSLRPFASGLRGRVCRAAARARGERDLPRRRLAPRLPRAHALTASDTGGHHPTRHTARGCPRPAHGTGRARGLRCDSPVREPSALSRMTAPDAPAAVRGREHARVCTHEAEGSVRVVFLGRGSSDGCGSRAASIGGGASAGVRVRVLA